MLFNLKIAFIEMFLIFAMMVHGRTAELENQTLVGLFNQIKAEILEGEAMDKEWETSQKLAAKWNC